MYIYRPILYLPVQIRASASQLSCASSEVKFDLITSAAIAQLGERRTEDLKVPGSIPGLGKYSFATFCVGYHCGCGAEIKRRHGLSVVPPLPAPVFQVILPSDVVVELCLVDAELHTFNKFE